MATAALPLRLAAAQEAEMRAEALRLFGLEADEVLAALDRLAARGLLPGDPFVKAAFRRILAAYGEGGAAHALWLERYGDLIARTVELGGQHLAASVGFDFTIRSPRVLRAIDDRTAELATHVTAGTAGRISAAVRNGYQEGVGVKAIATKIREEAFGGDVTRARATVIARTETVGAMAEGAHHSAVESGVFRFSVWRNQGDSRVRESHDRMEGERVPLGQRFSNGLRFVGDKSGDIAEWIQCRCYNEFLD